MTTVWLHGAGMNPDYWDLTRARGLRLCLPGHGGRPRVAETTPEAYAEALLPDCPERFDVVGHSLGGMVALVIAARYPQRVRRLVLADTWPGLSLAIAPPIGTWASDQVSRHLGVDGVASLLASYKKPQTRTIIRKALRQMSPGGLNDAMRAATTFDGWDLLPKIEAPTLILHARYNVFTYVLNLRMAQKLPDAGRRALPGGHAIHLDCPAQFYGAVERFLEVS